MGRRLTNAEIIAVWCAFAWLLLIMDAFFTWMISPLVRNYVSMLIVVFATLLLIKSGNTLVDRKRILLFFSVFLLFFYIVFFKKALRYAVAVYIPLMCFVFWEDRLILRVYELFKKFILFYAFVSIIVEFLVLTGLIDHLPHLVMPPQDSVQEQLNVENYVYGLFVVPRSNSDLVFYRACGPLREGGHFAIFLGFVYFIERLVSDRKRFALIIAGFLTLSPNFLLFFFFSEFFYSARKKRGGRFLLSFVAVIASLVGLYFILPFEIQTEVLRIVYERTLEGSLSSVGSEGLLALLDGRTNAAGMSMYSQLIVNGQIGAKLFGVNDYQFFTDYVLSDFRYLIVLYGFVGFALYLFYILSFSFTRGDVLFGTFVLLMAVCVLLQRAWMFEQVYIVVMMLFATTACRNQQSLVLV